MEFFINFNDLVFEKQQEIIQAIKQCELENLKQEAKEKNKSLKELLWEDYNIDFDLTMKEKEKYFETSLDEFLENLAYKKINKSFKFLSVYIDLL